MKILPNGIAVLEIDSHLSRWIEEHGRLDIDGLSIKAAARFIKPGDIVVDAGASLGDTTLAFLNAVGFSGSVLAFEPQLGSFECLKHNCPKAILYNSALGGRKRQVRVRPDPSGINIGAAQLEDALDGEISVVILDDLELPRLNFIKVDVEGFEVEVIDGAAETIKRCRPVMLLEVNHPVLAKHGRRWEEIQDRVEMFNYRVELADPRYGLDSDSTDIYLIPR